MANIAVPHVGGDFENVRSEEPPNRSSDDIPIFDDDVAEYVAGRIAGSQAELQKLRDQVESVTRKMRGKHEDLFKMSKIAKFNRNGDPRVYLR